VAGNAVTGARGKLMASGLADPALDERWLAGEPDALAEANQRYRSRLEAVAYRIVGNHADAEDVVQRVFLALPRAAYRGSASLWSYLYRAAVNGSVNLLRARKRQQNLRESAFSEALTHGSEGTTPEARILEGEVLAAVARALVRVKPQHRRVLVLRIHHGLSNKEIAEQEGLPMATVGTWLRRGREELRQELGPLLQEIGRKAT
jgi:RNA polymerase sigma-70 factor (ECF subfamily)